MWPWHWRGRASYGAFSIWRGVKGSAAGCQGIPWDPREPGAVGLAALRGAPLRPRGLGGRVEGPPRRPLAARPLHNALPPDHRGCRVAHPQLSPLCFLARVRRVAAFHIQRCNREAPRPPHTKVAPPPRIQPGLISLPSAPAGMVRGGGRGQQWSRETCKHAPARWRPCGELQQRTTAPNLNPNAIMHSRRRGGACEGPKWAICGAHCHTCMASNCMSNWLLNP